MESAVPIGNEFYVPLQFLSKKQWVQQALPCTISEFGPTPSRSDEHYSPFQVGPWDVSEDIDSLVAHANDSVPCVLPIDMGILAHNDPSEDSASFNFQVVLKHVGRLLGLDLWIQANPQARSSPGPHMDASQQAAMLASSSVKSADYGVSVNGKMFLVVEMKRPAVFRRTVNSAIPDLCSAASETSRPSSLTETVVLFQPVVQLYGYMKRMKLGYGIISSYDLTFLVHRGGDHGQTVYISEGIPSTSPKFLGALAYIVDKAFKEPILFESPDIKHVQGGIPQTFASGSSQSQGSQGGSKGRKQKERSPRHGLPGMRTRSHGPVVDGLLETPAELLHLAPHHFATGWSGRIVRGTYEGQHIVVKLAPTGSDRAEALLTEVMVYHKLKEFWGKYVPKLVSYGTTAGGMVVYIATEEIDGCEIGMGALSQVVVEEIIDALTVVHQCGILHGDIRPSNILVAKGQQVGARLIDFGFARPISSSEDCTREHAQLESLLNEFTYSDVGGNPPVSNGTNSGSLDRCIV